LLAGQCPYLLCASSSHPFPVPFSDIPLAPVFSFSPLLSPALPRACVFLPCPSFFLPQSFSCRPRGQICPSFPWFRAPCPWVLLFQSLVVVMQSVCFLLMVSF